MKKYTFHVSGTHCAACKILIEDVLGEQDLVKSVRVDLKKEIVEIEPVMGESLVESSINIRRIEKEFSKRS